MTGAAEPAWLLLTAAAAEAEAVLAFGGVAAAEEEEEEEEEEMCGRPNVTVPGPMRARLQPYTTAQHIQHVAAQHRRVR